MKHTAKVTFLLILIFLFAQVFGLYTLNTDLKVVKNADTGEVIDISYSEPAIGERPDVDSTTAFWYIVGGVVIGTLLLLLLIRLKWYRVWKGWFFLAVLLTVTTTLGVYMNIIIAFVIALSLTLIKIYKPNFIVQNITEIFMYTGIAFIFVPLLNISTMIILLVVISIYDAYAVWKSKHMVKMANFQTEAKVFAGLSIPYKRMDKGKSEIKIKIPKAHNYKAEEGRARVAILGGGDIAFPLLFSGVVMQSLVFDLGVEKLIALLEVQLITVFVTLALTYLFIYGKKNRFYPAMPYISAGALLGYGIIYLIQYLI